MAGADAKSEVDLVGRWVHSYEDDHDGVTVYRRPEYPFPPARGRRAIEFRPDGSFIEWAIGRGDAPEEKPGRWEPTSVGAAARADATGTALKVVHAAPDVLEVETEQVT